MSAKIAAALHHVMQSVGYVQKSGRNSFHNYKYAGEADLLKKLRPAMIEAGLILIPSVQTASPADEHGNVTVLVEYTLAHKDGDVWPEKVAAIGCGNDKAKNGSVGDKGVYKALTGANKYLLFKLFQIETGDDPEADAPQSSTMQMLKDSVAALEPATPAPVQLTMYGWKQKYPKRWHELERMVRECTSRDQLQQAWDATRDESREWPDSLHGDFERLVEEQLDSIEARV